LHVVEEMISLSSLIKSQFTNKRENDKQPIAVQAISELLKEKYKENVDPEMSQQASYLLQTSKNEAEQIIKTALAEKSRIAEQIEQERNAWIREREQLFEQVRLEGYAEGLELGRQEALKQYQANIEEAQRIIDLANKDYDEKVQSSEETILALSIKLAEKVISTKLLESRENFLPLVKQALNEVKEYENIKIHVHPTSYELLLSQKEELNLLVTNDTDISIYANAELEVNACFIESAFGRIDVSVDTQLQQLKKQLIELLG
jgi:flagellar assembly protein FliH